MRRTTAVAALALAALVLVRPASAADCWKAVLRDYADDGRIQATYPATCYRDAIRRMPITLKAYSDAYDVLTRTLAEATAHPQRRDGVLVVPPPLPPPSSGENVRRSGPPPFTRAADSFSSSEPDRVPLPLLVLGGLGLLFVAAGVAGALVRRSRGG